MMMPSSIGVQCLQSNIKEISSNNNHKTTITRKSKTYNYMFYKALLHAFLNLNVQVFARF